MGGEDRGGCFSALLCKREKMERTEEDSVYTVNIILYIYIYRHGGKGKNLVVKMIRERMFQILI